MQLHIGYSKIFSTCFHCINIFIISRHRNETQVGQVRQKHNSSIFMTFYSITESSNHPTLVTMSKPMHFNGMIFTQLEPPEPKVQQPSNLDLSAMILTLQTHQSFPRVVSTTMLEKVGPQKTLQTFIKPTQEVMSPCPLHRK